VLLVFAFVRWLLFQNTKTSVDQLSVSDDDDGNDDSVDEDDEDGDDELDVSQHHVDDDTDDSSSFEHEFVFTCVLQCCIISGFCLVMANMNQPDSPLASVSFPPPWQI